MPQYAEPLMTPGLRKRLNRGRTLLLLILLPLLGLVVTWSALKVYNHLFTDGPISRTVDKVWNWGGQPVGVSLKPPVSGSGTAPEPVAEVIFCLDTSGSMGSLERHGDPLQQAAQTTRILSQMLIVAGSPVGLVGFDSKAYPLVPPTTDLTQLHTGWQDLPGGGGTDIPNALQQSVAMFTKDSGLKRVIVLISDGFGDGSSSLRLIKEHSENDQILFVGIGIGGGSSMEFFNSTFQEPNRALCCDNDFRKMVELLTEIGVDHDVFASIGYLAEITETPHLSALPFIQETPEGKDPGLMEPILEADKGSLLFPLIYYLDIPHSLNYYLKAEAWGVHPVATAPTHLSYRDQADGSAKTLKSGAAPMIFVVTPLLLFLLFLPAMIYAFLMVTQKVTGTLMHPSNLPEPVMSWARPLVALRRFRRHSLEPLAPNDERELIPTAVVALGPRAGEVLAALIANRVESGLPEQSATFLPIYLDCRDLREQDFPPFTTVRLHAGLTRTLPQENSLTSLLRHIEDHPSDHTTLLSWFDSAPYAGRSIDTRAGFQGDRRLARLAIYQDLKSDEPVLRALAQDIGDWLVRNPTGQVMLVAALEEDMGSAWLIDTAYCIRRACGDRAVPIHAFLDCTSDIPFGEPANRSALLKELQVVQNASGWPFSGPSQMVPEDSDGSPHPGSQILLPLFDRVLLLGHMDRPAHAGAAGAALHEWCDRGLAQLMVNALDVDAPIKRASGQRSADCFLTELDTTTVLAPVGRWRRRWSLWLARDLLEAWLGAMDPKPAVELPNDLNTTWQQLKSSDTRPTPVTPVYWDRVLAGSVVEEGFAGIKSDVFLRELIAMAADFLNANGEPKQPAKDLMKRRRGRFATLAWFASQLASQYEHITKLQAKVHQEPKKAIRKFAQLLTAWQEALFTSPEAERPAFREVIHRELQLLDQKDPSQNTLGGRVGVSAERPTTDPGEAYTCHVRPLAIESGTVPTRMSWSPSADGTDLELSFDGLINQRFTREEIRQGQLIDALGALLSQNLMPEMANWSLEEWVPDKKLAPVIAGLSVRDEGAVFALHGFRDGPRRSAVASSIQNRLSHPFIGEHSYTDRLGFLSIRENRRVREEQEQDALPTIYPEVGIPALLMRAQTGRLALPDSGLDATTMLLASDLENLDCALVVVCLGAIIRREVSASFSQCHFDPRDEGRHAPLTALGNPDQSLALFQLMLRRRDIEGNPVDPFEVMSLWQTLPHARQQALLAEFDAEISEAREPRSWETLLWWRANQKLQNGGM